MADDDRQLNLPKREEEILKFWEEHKIFEKTLAKTKRGKPFVFYEGPPTANGSPGIHHFEARAFKDVIPRYQTMRGRFVARKSGWDTHGLPVEIQVEKELGLKTKRDIEKYGIAKFNAKCRESVWRYKEEWDRFTRRMGFWLDLERPYITYETSYIESLWWVIKEFSKRRLLYQDFKVMPWCPRCETGLSTHELGQPEAYRTVKERSLYVRFRVKSGELRWKNMAILAWTTTPWTLPGNVALAINPNEDYVAIPDPEVKRQWLILGQKRFRDLVEASRFPAEYRSSLMLDDIDTFKGSELVGLEYEPLFSVRELKSKNSHRVYAADFVTMGDGTGVVHTAVMYGEDDYRLGSKVGLPKVHTVDETGRFTAAVPEGLAHLAVKDAKTEEAIIASLKGRDLLFAEELYEHEYPHCWRCNTALLYYARSGWWVKASSLRKQLLANNAKVQWVPEHLKRGRFGEFLKEVRDWAFSRERYWGTPLPVWQCGECSHREVIGSLAEFIKRAPPAENHYWAMRHGQSENLMLGIADDDEKTYALTPKGERQVREAATRLKHLGLDLIVTSPIRRTAETAAIVGKALGLRVVADERLREIHVGTFEHRPPEEYHRFFSSTLEKFIKRPPHGESLDDLKARLASLFGDLEAKYRGEKILLISHEYPIWILSGVAAGLSDEAMAAVHDRAGEFIGPAGIVATPYRQLPRDERGEVNLHRPYVDEFVFVCSKCRAAMRRVPEVVDVWFDSGAMPFAQHHYPFEHAKDLPYPADYICEGVDQTRGWFYSLLAVSTALGRGPSYKNVVSLGHVLDKNDQKMSKSKGNVVNPFDMIAKYGTDAIRWYFYTINAPGDPKRFDERDIALKLRGAISMLWNIFVFFDTYVDRIRIREHELPKISHPLDRFILGKFIELEGVVTEHLDKYDVVAAARNIEAFIDHFSTWYLQNSRRRFQKPASVTGKNDAAAVAAFVLLHLSELIAPFMPFLAESVYRRMKEKLGLREESVHLRSWPRHSKKAALSTQEENMLQYAIWLVSQVLGQRAGAKIKVRQPLQEFTINAGSLELLKTAGLIDVVKARVNVKEIISDKSAGGGTVVLNTAITPELHEEGLVRELIRNIQEMRRDAGLKPQQKIRIQVSGERDSLDLASRWKKTILDETGAAALDLGGQKRFDVERESDIGGRKLWLGIRRI